MNFFISFKELQSNIFKKENIYFLLIILGSFFVDRYSKNIIINNFSENNYYVNNYINLDLIWNIGIGFGLFKTDSFLIYNLVTLLIGLVIIVLILVLFNSNKLEKLIYSIIIGGASGNFYDRLEYKAVPDFIDLHLNNFHWFTFNVADIFITLGIVIYIVRSIFVRS